MATDRQTDRQASKQTMKQTNNETRKVHASSLSLCKRIIAIERPAIVKKVLCLSEEIQEEAIVEQAKRGKKNSK
jgi:hypothetical protein